MTAHPVPMIYLTVFAHIYIFFCPPEMTPIIPGRIACPCSNTNLIFQRNLRDRYHSLEKPYTIPDPNINPLIIHQYLRPGKIIF